MFCFVRGGAGWMREERGKWKRGREFVGKKKFVGSHVLCA